MKQDKFKLWLKKRFGWPEKGTLTLYNDRLVWNGGSSFEIPIGNIVNVSVTDTFGAGFLEISDGDELPFKFQKTNTTTTAIALFVDIGLAAMSDKKVSDLEAWRQIIEKLRGN